MKPRISKAELYVCKYHGQETGYGKTPKAAHDDFNRRRKQAVERREAIDYAWKACREATAELQRLVRENTRLHQEAHLTPAGDWVLMACLVFGCEPDEALARMRDHGAEITMIEHRAVEHIEKLQKTWKERLGLDEEEAIDKP